MTEKQGPDSSDIGQETSRWHEETYEPAVEKSGERDVPFETSSSKPVDPLYTPQDTAADYLDKLGFPGEYPYTRGVQPTMYRGKLWTERQYAGFGSAEDTNERYKFLLSRGQAGLSVALDLPTHLGYDADDPVAEAEVGNVGVSICSLKDVEIMFDGIPLEKVSVSWTENATASMMLAMHVAAAKRRGIDPKDLRGTMQNDILKEYISRGTYIYPPRPSMRLITDTFAYCKKETPYFNPISISGYHMREAGCTAAQEVGFTMADAIAYSEAAIDAGLDFDEFAPRLSFFWAIHSNFLEEIAKSRASRRLWARIAKDRFGAKDKRAMMLRLHVQTGGATLTRQQPDNNIIRGAFQALAAVLGGTQSMSVSCKDEALGLPTEEAQQISLRIQQIIAHETGVVDTIDPLAGSYYIEHLTDQIEVKAQDYIDRIDAMGGAVTAIEQGFQQGEIQEAAYRIQQDIESKRRIVVGVNEYIVKDEEPPKNIHRRDLTVGKKQRERLMQLKAERDNEKVEDLKRCLEQAAVRNENLISVFIECFEHDMTLGEVCGVLRKVWGEYQGSAAI